MNEGIEKLIELLEEKNFIGTDISLEESLLYYGMVVRKIDGFTILCTADNDRTYLFGVTTISTNDIKNAIEEMEEGFYNFIGIPKEQYINDLKIDIKNNNDLAVFIQDIRQYNDRLTYDIYYTLTADELINILNHN